MTSQLPLFPTADATPVRQRIFHATLHGVSWAGASVEVVRAMHRLEDLRIAAEAYGDDETAALARKGQELVHLATVEWDTAGEGGAGGRDIFVVDIDHALSKHMINTNPSPFGARPWAGKRPQAGRSRHE